MAYDVDTSHVAVLPKRFKCPHCGKWTALDRWADETFRLCGKVIRQCNHCGYIHFWRKKEEGNGQAGDQQDL